MTLTLAVNAPDDVATYYVNHMEIAHTKHEFSILVGQLPAKMSDATLKLARESGELRIDPVLQLLVPPTIIPGLLRAIQIQREKYEKENGKISDSSN